MKKISKISMFIGGAVVLAALAGCNTVQGFGKDLSAGGNALANAADKVKNSGKKQDDQVKYSDVNDAAFQDESSTAKK